MPNLCHINSTRAERWPHHHHHHIVNLEPKLECRNGTSLSNEYDYEYEWMRSVCGFISWLFANGAEPVSSVFFHRLNDFQLREITFIEIRRIFVTSQFLLAHDGWSVNERSNCIHLCVIGMQRDSFNWLCNNKRKQHVDRNVKIKYYRFSFIFDIEIIQWTCKKCLSNEVPPFLL